MLPVRITATVVVVALLCSLLLTGIRGRVGKLWTSCHSLLSLCLSYAVETNPMGSVP